MAARRLLIALALLLSLVIPAQSHDLARYWALSRLMEPGDVIAFSGTGFVSESIQFLTGSPISHVGMVTMGIWRPELGRIDIQITESTLTKTENGVVSNWLSTRIANYDKGGCIYWAPLGAETRRQIDRKGWARLYDYIRESTGTVEYGTWDLITWPLRQIPVVRRFFPKSNMRKLFCSGYDVAIFEAVGVLRGYRLSDVTPQDLMSMHLFSNAVPLAGTCDSIPDFNTL